MAWRLYPLSGSAIALVLSARIVEGSRASPGTLEYPESRSVFAGCGRNSALELLEVQLGGKKRISARAFINGYKPAESERLGGQE